MAGKRSGLFYQITRLADEIRPEFVFLENVPAITVRGLREVAGEFTRLGYDCRWSIISAKEVGAAHLRRRWFMLAHSGGKSLRLSEPRKWHEEIHASGALETRETSDSLRARLEGREPSSRFPAKESFTTDLLEGDNWDEYARFLLRMDHGVPHRGDRIKALGNSVVPIQVKTAFEKLMGLA